MPVPEIQVRNAEQRTLSAEADRLFLAGAYHSGDPNDNFITDSMLSGCALGIADVDHIDKVSFEGAANRLGLADPLSPTGHERQPRHLQCSAGLRQAEVHHIRCPCSHACLHWCEVHLQLV